GVTGSFFRALAVTMTVSLFTSLLLALSWTPTLSQYLVRRRATPSDEAESSSGGDVAALLAAEEAHLSGFFGRVVAFYARAMEAVLKHRLLLAASSVVIIILAFVRYRALGSDLQQTEPAAKVEFVQVLQDMIGDLTSQPEPIVIKLFSQDPKLLANTAPRVAGAIQKVHGVVDVLDGIENTISGPATTFQINPAVAAR